MLTHQPFKNTIITNRTYRGREVHIKSTYHHILRLYRRHLPFFTSYAYNHHLLHINPRKNLPCVRADTRTCEAVTYQTNNHGRTCRPQRNPPPQHYLNIIRHHTKFLSKQVGSSTSEGSKDTMNHKHYSSRAISRTITPSSPASESL